jgi:FHA domain
MDSSCSSFSDDALSQLIFESQTTVTSAGISTRDIPSRIQQFNRLYAEITTKPQGAALLYQESENGPASWRELPDKLIVGRLSKSSRNPSGCDLVIHDDEMSRVHFEIVCVDGFSILRDLNSRNGTRINNDPEKIQERVLKAGDSICAGRTTFVFTGE